MTNIPIINNINAILGGRTEILKLWTTKHREYELQQAVIYVIELGQDPKYLSEFSPLIGIITYKLRHLIKRINSDRLREVNKANEMMLELCDCLNQTNSYWGESESTLICNFIDSSLTTHEWRYYQCARIKALHQEIYGTPIPQRIYFKSALIPIRGQEPIHSQYTYDNMVKWIILLKSQPTLLDCPRISDELHLCETYLNRFNRDDLPLGEPIKTAKTIVTGEPDLGDYFKVHWEDINNHQYFSRCATE